MDICCSRRANLHLVVARIKYVSPRVHVQYRIRAHIVFNCTRKDVERSKYITYCIIIIFKGIVCACV